MKFRGKEVEELIAGNPKFFVDSGSVASSPFTKSGIEIGRNPPSSGLRFSPQLLTQVFPFILGFFLLRENVLLRMKIEK